jgi:hypothetical protein
VPFGRSPACEWLTRARRPANGVRRSLGAATNRLVLALFDVTAEPLCGCRPPPTGRGWGAGELLILTPPLSRIAPDDAAAPLCVSVCANSAHN